MKKYSYLIRIFLSVFFINLTLTSCLDSGDDDDSNNGSFMGISKVSRSMGSIVFQLLNDSKPFPIYPSASSLSEIENNTDFNINNISVAYIGGSYPIADQSSTDVTQLTSIVNANLAFIQPLDAHSTFVMVEEKGAANDSVNYAPIISLEHKSSGGDNPFFFDSNTLIIPINYYLYDAYHSFSLIYYMDSDAEIPTLYLRHNNKGETRTDYSSLSLNVNSVQRYPSIYYYAFNLTSLFHYIEVPTEVKIVTIENANSVSLDNASGSVVENTYTVKYDPIIKY